MEQFVLVLAAVYNKNLITHSVTKQELPKYQPLQNPTYQIDSTKKEMNKDFYSKAHSLVDKIWSCPRIKLSNSQTLILDGEETGIFLLDFEQQLRRKNTDFPDIYFTLLDAAGISPTPILNQSAKLKREEAGSLSNSEPQKLQRLYTQGGAVYRSVCNLVKARNQPVSKMRQFLHSKPSYTKFTLATHKVKRMKAFARFKNGIWCIDLAYVDKLAKENNGVKYLLVRQGLFDRTVDAKRMKRKHSDETVRAFLPMITKKNRSKKIRVDKGTEFAGEFKKLCKAEGIQNYSAMSETKAADSERTIRSLKNILYRYMEDNGYKYLHKLTQNVLTLNSRRNCSIDLISKNVKNSNFLFNLYSKPLREVRKPKFKIGNRVRISKYDLPFRKGYKPQFTKKVFKIVSISSKRPPTYTKRDEQDEIILGKFHLEELIKFI